MQFTDATGGAGRLLEMRLHMTDLSAYSVDAVKGLVRNGPPPGANGSGHAAVDSFAAFASLALLADPAATLAKMGGDPGPGGRG
jgi:hypothetical protein